jgi:muramoyltetrapeptide carboxypeptidase
MSKYHFPALLPGQTIGVIAPAGPATAEALACAPAVLEVMGYRVKMFPGCQARSGFLAGDDNCRLNDLHAAFIDPQVSAILCLRGGYGSGRLLDRIDWALIEANAKPLIGYSDITALHAQLSNRGIPSFHGPMLTSDLVGECDPLTRGALDVLRTGLPEGYCLEPELGRMPLRIGGQAHGKLVGGNLSLIAALMGTPYALDVSGSILFLEDVSEAPYRVDRLLLQLQLGGLLEQAKGFLLGGFTGSDEPADEVLRDYLLPLSKPVLSGWPAGHCQPNTLLPLGVQVALDADLGTVTLLEAAIAA